MATTPEQLDAWAEAAWGRCVTGPIRLLDEADEALPPEVFTIERAVRALRNDFVGTFGLEFAEAADKYIRAIHTKARGHEIGLIRDALLYALNDTDPLRRLAVKVTFEEPEN